MIYCPQQSDFHTMEKSKTFPYFHENWLSLVLETKYYSFIDGEVTARENKSFAQEPESESWSLKV